MADDNEPQSLWLSHILAKFWPLATAIAVFLIFIQVLV